MGTRCLLEPILILVGRNWRIIRHPDHLHPRTQRNRLQALSHLVGMGHRPHLLLRLRYHRRNVEIWKEDLFPTGRFEGQSRWGGGGRQDVQELHVDDAGEYAAGLEMGI